MINQRFWSKVDKTDTCWNWTASRFWHGYGCFGVKEGEKYKTRYAHRVAYEEVVGPIPDGLFVLHKCDNRGCVRPDHLFLGTQLDNMRDCSRKGRKPGVPRFGEQNPQSKLTADDVKEIRRIGKSMSQQKIANMFGVSQTLIGLILRGKSWSHTYAGPANH